MFDRIRRLLACLLRRRTPASTPGPYPDEIACDVCRAPLTSNKDCRECVAAKARVHELAERNPLDRHLLIAYVREERRAFHGAGLRPPTSRE